MLDSVQLLAIERLLMWLRDETRQMLGHGAEINVAGRYLSFYFDNLRWTKISVNVATK